MAARLHADDEAAGWFFEHSLDLFVVVEAGAVVRANPAWTRATGWSLEETLGRPFAAFGWRDDAGLLPCVGQSLDETGEAEIEHRLRGRTGAPLWVRTRAKKVGANRIVIVMQDITEEHLRKLESAQSQRANELLRETAGILLWRYDPIQNVYEYDPDFSRPIGAAAANADLRERANVLNVIHRADGERMQAVWDRTLQTGEPGLVEYRRRREDGGWDRVRTAWRGVRPGPDGRWEILGVTQDVTELAEARDAAIRGERAAQAAAEAKSQFLANISHEIRTPMNGVLGVLHLLKTEPLSTEGRRLLDEALSCGRMLAGLLDDVIDFSKIEAGGLELSPEPTDVAAAVQGVVELLKAEAAAKGLRLRTEGGGEPVWARADPVRLRQILFNLIGNAVKFTITGGVEVRIAEVGEPQARRVRVEVQDTGIGIPKEAKDGLFLRFNQADNSATRRYGGSGLGLAITRRLAELMGGTVDFTSRLGRGSTFWLETPACEAPAADDRVDADDGRWLEGFRVLVVEDNPTNRLIATKMLENLGASVETADDGVEGVEAARRQSFDLIFMDIQMPEMDGVTAARAIRSLAGPASRTPIVAMTANTMAHQVESYRAAGMNGHVSKPVSPAALLTELVRVTSEESSSANAQAAVGS